MFHEIFLKGKAHHHMFLKHLKESDCTIKNVIFLQSIMALLQVVLIVWKEDLNSDTLTNRQDIINTISKGRPKFFSGAHK